MTDKPEPPPRPDGGAAKTPAKADSRKHREEMLDEALKETFPASDPPAITICRPSSDSSS